MKIDPKLKDELKRTLLEDLQKKARIVTIETANSLSKKQLEDIYEKVPFLKTMTVQFKINKKLLAGFIIKQGSTINDYSLSTKISQIKRNLYEIT